MSSALSRPALVGGWGLAYDTNANRAWITNSSRRGRGESDSAMASTISTMPDGTQTGETIDVGGRMAGRRRLRRANRDDLAARCRLPARKPATCLFETDPVTKAVTGKQICGPWTDFPGLVGLAYDYSTDTYYAGDQLGIIYHIDSAGNLLDSGPIGLQISGLAFNPTTRHLFVTVFGFLPFDMYVVSPDKGYSVLSGFVVQSKVFPCSTLAESASRPTAMAISGF